MITLNADNRILTEGAKFAFLTNNYSPGTAVVNLTATTGFSIDDIVLVGDFGQETAELFRIGAINTDNGDVTLRDMSGNQTSLMYGHPESTKVYQLEYDQVRFYWTAATGTIADEDPVFDTATPLTGYVDIDPTGWFSTYTDSTHSSGFGWFVYYNSITLTVSDNSNPIPYGGFEANTVASVFADFDSLLNISELRLVTTSERFAWLNEAIAILKNKLNLTNVEYTVPTPVTINVVAGTAEYQLEADFGDMIAVTNTENGFAPRKIDFIPLYEVDSYTGTTLRYYIRNRYIGFAPTPATTATYTYRYRAKATKLTSLSDYIDLPDNAFYALKDWMMYRACLKFSNSNAQTFYQGFNNSVGLFMQAAVKRDANTDSWDIARTANV